MKKCPFTSSFLAIWFHHSQWSNMAYMSAYDTSPSFAEHAKSFSV